MQIFPLLNRRKFVLLASGAALATAGAQLPARGREPLQLRTRKTSYAFERPATDGLISMADNAPPPVIRMTQGVPFEADVTNGLDDYTTVHWHGLRIPNEMDGVPYLTQLPLGKNDTFRYAFTPPDAGTHWYHPHCMTMSQMAHGLTGMIIVEEPDKPGFDAEVPLNLKDFRLDDEGKLLPYFTARGAARGGTLGNVQTVNWQINPVYDVPAGGLVRLRIMATDTTRVYKLVLPDAPGRIIAWDGHPVEQAIAWPTEEAPLQLAPGQRIDVALRVPDSEGMELPLRAVIGTDPRELARLRATGAPLNRNLAELRALPRNPIQVPDLPAADVKELVFGWTPEGGANNNGFCGSYEYTFWSIDRTPWPGDAAEGTAPIADLVQGKSYILRLRNESPNMHPIHLHGLAFMPIKSNRRQLLRNWTDTILLLKNETIDIALKADNPGNWAFHCHVIEHQKTGLAGYVRVS